MPYTENEIGSAEEIKPIGVAPSGKIKWNCAAQFKYMFDKSYLLGIYT